MTWTIDLDHGIVKDENVACIHKYCKGYYVPVVTHNWSCTINFCSNAAAYQCSIAVLSMTCGSGICLECWNEL